MALILVQLAESTRDGVLMLQHELLEAFVLAHDLDVLPEHLLFGLKGFSLHDDHLFLDALGQVVLAAIHALLVEQASLLSSRFLALALLIDLFFGLS